jgi:hypothetical protein
MVASAITTMSASISLLSERISRAALATIDTAAHFMIAAHPNEVGRLIAQHLHRAEAVLNATVAVCEMAAIGTSGSRPLL